MFLDLENVYKVYGDGTNKIYALNGISFGVERGEYVSVIGQSGSGKSTFMNILGCLDYPTGGRYFLDNNDIMNASDKQLSEIRNKEIGFVFQSFNLLPYYTAAENVELPLIYRGMDKARRRELVSAALEKVSLSERRNHRPSELSGGQQQRVAIARAIAASPPIILADEPTGNLDSKTSNDIMEILDGLNKLGTTVILITHSMQIAARAGRTVKIDDGIIAGNLKK